VDDELAKLGMNATEIDGEAIEAAAKKIEEEQGEGEDDGSQMQSFRDLLGPDCVIKRVDKDKNVLSVVQPEEMQHEMMTKASAQKRLGACADHVTGMNRKDKLDWALDLKDRANEYYGDNKFEEAAKLYNDCLVALDFDGTEEENTMVARRLQLPVCTNLAACMIEMGQNSRTVEICNIALSVDPRSPKATYRRGLAYYRLGNHRLARPDFEVALTEINNTIDLQVDSKDADESEIKSLRDLKKRVILYLSNIRIYNAQEKESAKKVFKKDKESKEGEQPELYKDRPDVKEKEEAPAFDDSDEAINAKLAQLEAEWACCPCRRRAKLKHI